MAELRLDGQCLQLFGQIDYLNAEEFCQQGYRLLASHSVWPVQVDLSEVEHGNTLLLAMIIQWLRKCPQMDSLGLVKVPNKMLGIIKASHLEHLIVD